MGNVFNLVTPPPEGQPLEHNGDNDYTLKEGHRSCWVSVGEWSVYILVTADGKHVDVDITPHGDEFSQAPMDASATSRVYRRD